MFNDYENLLQQAAQQQQSQSQAQSQGAYGGGDQHSLHSSHSFVSGHNIPAGQGSRFGSVSSSHMGSEANYNEFNEAGSISSLNSGILSPYSTGSSPDGFFLSATTSNAGSQASLDDFGLDLDAGRGLRSDPFGNVGAASHNNNNGEGLYGQNLVPVPMGESMSNSTVTFNNADLGGNMNNFEPMNAVKEEDESPESRRSNFSDYNKNSGGSGGREDSTGGTIVGPNGKKIKSSHNLIEKKYRTNINSKIIELRNCVPALRILIAKAGNHRTRTVNNEKEAIDDYYEGNGYTDDEEKCDGLKPAKKLNKATILSKASEYIKHLEKKNDMLRIENEHLKSLLDQRQSPQIVHGQQLQQQQQQMQQQQQQQQNMQQPHTMYNSSSMHSSPYNPNSGSSHGNLISPIGNFEPVNYDHQMLNNKLMGEYGNFQMSAQQDRKYM